MIVVRPDALQLSLARSAGRPFFRQRADASRLGFGGTIAATTTAYIAAGHARGIRVPTADQ
jgi:hypothetical protein